MCLREILERIVEKNDQILLCDRNDREWEARMLLESLSEPMLKRQAYLQPGLYIAEINDKGYLGCVLFKVKLKVAAVS